MRIRTKFKCMPFRTPQNWLFSTETRVRTAIRWDQITSSWPKKFKRTISTWTWLLLIEDRAIWLRTNTTCKVTQLWGCIKEKIRNISKTSNFLKTDMNLRKTTFTSSWLKTELIWILIQSYLKLLNRKEMHQLDDLNTIEKYLRIRKK